MTEAAAKLIQLTGDLKVALDKSAGESFDLNLMQKVDKIAMTAHAVKEEMKLGVTAK
jgi:hypothetical protein